MHFFYSCSAAAKASSADQGSIHADTVLSSKKKQLFRHERNTDRLSPILPRLGWAATDHTRIDVMADKAGAVIPCTKRVMRLTPSCDRASQDIRSVGRSTVRHAGRTYSITGTVRGVVTFAAAAGSWERSPELRERLRAAAEKTAAPIMLIQAANDYSTAPSYALADELETSAQAASVEDLSAGR